MNTANSTHKLTDMDKVESSNHREKRMDEILCAYLESAEEQAQRLEDWISRYPEFEAELKSFVADYEAAAERFRSAVTAGSWDRSTARWIA